MPGSGTAQASSGSRAVKRAMALPGDCMASAPSLVVCAMTRTSHAKVKPWCAAMNAAGVWQAVSDTQARDASSTIEKGRARELSRI